MSKKATEAPKMVKIKLLAPHTHKGVEYKTGDEIEVTEAQAAWLQDEWKKNPPKKDGQAGTAKEVK